MSETLSQYKFELEHHVCTHVFVCTCRSTCMCHKSRICHIYILWAKFHRPQPFYFDRKSDVGGVVTA